VATSGTMKRVMTGMVAVVAVAVAVTWIARSQQAANGTTALQSSGPLIARGYTEAPAGTVMIANDPNGGSVLKELRIKEGQIVKRDEIIAVMGNYQLGRSLSQRDVALIVQFLGTLTGPSATAKQ